MSDTLTAPPETGSTSYPLAAPDANDKKWAIHVIGPDDVLFRHNFATALQEANEMNISFSKIERTQETPYMIAVVVPASEVS